MLFRLISEPIALIAFLAAIIIGITIHEYAHAWAAYKFGDFTAKYQGRVSLNPTRHIDPLGAIFLLFVGFGWGKPVPVNPYALKGKYDELKISLAGPASNVILAFILSIPIQIALAMGISYETNLTLAFLKIIIEINIILAAFNLLPIAPLDGSRILTTLFPNSRSAQSFTKSGPTILLMLILIEYFLEVRIISTAIMFVGRLFSLIINAPINLAIDAVEYIVALF